MVNSSAGGTGKPPRAATEMKQHHQDDTTRCRDTVCKGSSALHGWQGVGESMLVALLRTVWNISERSALLDRGRTRR